MSEDKKQDTPVNVEDIRKVSRAILNEVGKIIVGKRDVLRNVLVSLLSKGHILLEGVPGVAKTELAKAFATTLGCEFRRIQFTPDLLPSDILGSVIFDQQKAQFYLRKGPIFANILLADEINRAPPKTQAALLESMQEMQVTIEGKTNILPQPFLVLATQNPLEQEGTYPLPEAQIDRFLFRIIVDYPTEKEEIELLLRKNKESSDKIRRIANPKVIVQMQEEVNKIHIEPSILSYIKDIIIRTRNDPQILLGASPRASIVLLKASKSLAAITGRDFVIPDDVKSVAFNCLNHRLILRPEIELEGMSTRRIIDKIIEAIPIP
jgi:MoxR-like ATPase